MTQNSSGKCATFSLMPQKSSIAVDEWTRYQNLLSSCQENLRVMINQQLAHHILMGDQYWWYKDDRIFYRQVYHLDFDIEIHGNMLINMRGRNGSARTA